MMTVKIAVPESWIPEQMYRGIKIFLMIFVDGSWWKHSLYWGITIIT